MDSLVQAQDSSTQWKTRGCLHTKFSHMDVFVFPKAGAPIVWLILFTTSRQTNLPMCFSTQPSSQQNHQTWSGQEVTFIPPALKNSRKIPGSLFPAFNPWADAACWTGGKMSSRPKMIIHLSLTYITYLAYCLYVSHCTCALVLLPLPKKLKILNICFKSGCYNNSNNWPCLQMEVSVCDGEDAHLSKKCL